MVKTICTLALDIAVISCKILYKDLRILYLLFQIHVRRNFQIFCLKAENAALTTVLSLRNWARGTRGEN